MDQGRTDQQGKFDLQGEASDLVGDIDPWLKIYHSCNKPLTQV